MIWQTFQQKGQLFLIEGKFYTLFKLTVKYNYNKKHKVVRLFRKRKQTQSLFAASRLGAHAQRKGKWKYWAPQYCFLKNNRLFRGKTGHAVKFNISLILEKNILDIFGDIY